MSLLCGCGNEEQAIKCVCRERSESLVPSQRALRVSCSIAHVICLVFPPCCGHRLPALRVKLLSVCLQWMGDWSELQKSFLKLRHDQCLVNIGLIYQWQQWFVRLSIRGWCQSTSTEWESAFCECTCTTEGVARPNSSYGVWAMWRHPAVLFCAPWGWGRAADAGRSVHLPYTVW